MSDEEARSVLERVSQWLGRKKPTNSEENGKMPQDQEKPVPQEDSPQAPDAAVAPAAPDQAPAGFPARSLNRSKFRTGRAF
ncbi:hypothetical protein [Desulfurivibrio sp. C05AmB]|uniref:hypothetical protein n=1 Tax=Desulfurivibrio sp. C05AmB TaxID=3374371 RepID=UPI00376EA976